MAMTPSCPSATPAADPRRRQVLGLLSSLACGAVHAKASARPLEPFPVRPITLWVPWAAGGATDLTIRTLAESAGRELRERILVDNRGGAGGTLVMPVLQQAAPDGYTLAQLPQPVLRAPWLRHTGWDPIRDTTPIIQVSGVTFGIVVPATSPWRSLDDLFAWAQAHPGEITIATNGVGTTPHVVMDDLFSRRQLDFVHVPYKGTAEQMIAVSSGQVMVGVNSNGFAPFVDSGRLRLLVTFGEQRSPRWPQVPTLKELGYGIVANSPYGIVGPRGLPDEIVQRLHEVLRRAMHGPEHRAALALYDQDLAYLGPADYGLALQASYEAERRIVARLGLRQGSGPTAP